MSAFAVLDLDQGPHPAARAAVPMCFPLCSPNDQSLLCVLGERFGGLASMFVSRCSPGICGTCCAIWSLQPDVLSGLTHTPVVFSGEVWCCWCLAPTLSGLYTWGSHRRKHFGKAAWGCRRHRWGTAADNGHGRARGWPQTAHMTLATIVGFVAENVVGHAARSWDVSGRHAKWAQQYQRPAGASIPECACLLFAQPLSLLLRAIFGEVGLAYRSVGPEGEVRVDHRIRDPEKRYQSTAPTMFTDGSDCYALEYVTELPQCSFNIAENTRLCNGFWCVSRADPRSQPRVGGLSSATSRGRSVGGGQE